MLSNQKLIGIPLKELQRRLDQTLGKPGSYLAGIDRVGNVKPMTVGARLYRVEQQVDNNFPNQLLITKILFLQLGNMDKKLDSLTYILNALAQKQQISLRTLEDDV